MFDVSTITKALVDVLEAKGLLNDVTFERNTRINTDTNLMPWGGVYQKSLTYLPKILGTTFCTRWKGDVVVSLVLQTFNLIDEGTEASDELEKIAYKCEQTINENITLGVMGCRVVGITREYTYVMDDSDDSGGLFFPQCILNISIQMR